MRLTPFPGPPSVGLASLGLPSLGLPSLDLPCLALLCLALLSAGPAMAQDVSAGERVWNKCRACHQVGETAKNTVGPMLNGLFGRPAGTVAGYNYSEANKNSGITWDESVFAEYIKDPRGKIPGTKMAFQGLKSDKEIADLTAFLAQFGADGKKR